jgi:phosphoglycolate phosphatase-like HAD superfamily hydrolase
LKLLVLDFDGVLSDSARESFEVALRSYRFLGRHDAFADSDIEALFRDFLEIMPLGNRSEDFAIALAALERGIDLPDQRTYDGFRAGLDEDYLGRFHARFYRERDSFAQQEPDRWHQLLAPYPRFLALLRARAGQCPYAIATAKDRRSVLQLLERYGVRDLFPEERILDKETGVSKVEHHRWLAEQTGAAYCEMAFVDDKVNHLDKVGKLGVRCILAAWGYNGPREHRAALAAGHAVCTLDTIESQLFHGHPQAGGSGDARREITQ